MTNMVQNWLWKCIWCAWDSNTGPLNSTYILYSKPKQQNHRKYLVGSRIVKTIKAFLLGTYLGQLAMIVVLDSSNKSDSWIVQNFASFEVIARQLRKIMMGIWDHLRLPKVGSIRLASKVTKSPNVYKKLPKIARLISARNMNDFDQFWSQSNKPILV